MPWYASTITADPLAVAAVAAAGRLPWLVFALLAGVIGDRVVRRVGGVIVTVAEPGLGRDWALRLPYLVAGATVALLVIFVRRALSMALIRDAQAATASQR